MKKINLRSTIVSSNVTFVTSSDSKYHVEPLRTTIERNIRQQYNNHTQPQPPWGEVHAFRVTFSFYFFSIRHLFAANALGESIWNRWSNLPGCFLYVVWISPQFSTLIPTSSEWFRNSASWTVATTFSNIMNYYVKYILFYNFLILRSKIHPAANNALSGLSISPSMIKTAQSDSTRRLPKGLKVYSILQYLIITSTMPDKINWHFRPKRRTIPISKVFCIFADFDGRRKPFRYGHPPILAPHIASSWTILFMIW